ncbi:MAG: glycerol-3-phosphate acyltransferase, partial [Armatimonadota bacterium]
MIVVALLLAAYLLGSTPTSFLLARYGKGIDLREFGSGNLGATNLFRAAGPGYAAICMVVDVGKGFVPTWLFPGLDGL